MNNAWTITAMSRYPGKGFLPSHIVVKFNWDKKEFTVVTSNIVLRHAIAILPLVESCVPSSSFGRVIRCEGDHRGEPWVK